MKKIMALLLASVMVFSVAACSKPAEESPATTVTEETKHLGTVRVGVGRYTEKSSIDELIAALIDILNS